jgi:uncharacterized protein (UPF0333 family)
MGIWINKPQGTTVDDDSINRNAGSELQIEGYDSASLGFIPYKTAGGLDWKPDAGSIEFDELSIDVDTGSKFEVKGFETAIENDAPYKNALGSLGWKNRETFSHIDFDMLLPSAIQEGRLAWDNDNHTLTLGLPNGSALQLGQELYIRAKNTQGSQINNGQIVYLYGASENTPEVRLALASNTSAKATIAVATQNVANNTPGNFTTFGLVRDINTEGMTEGGRIYLSDTTPGTFTQTLPTKPNVRVCIGWVIRASATVGAILVNIHNHVDIDELNDVSIISPVDKQVLNYNSVTGIWENTSTPQFGDPINGDYTEFEEDGTVKFNGGATVWDDISLSGLSFTPGTAAAPDVIDFVNENCLVFGFDGNNTTERLYLTTELKHDYLEGSDIEFHIHWTPTTTNTGNVKWQVYYTWIEKDGTYPTPQLLTVLSPARGTAWQNTYVSFGTISGVGKTINSQLALQIFRVPSDAEDTYADDAAFVAFGIHYQKDTCGSREMTTK